MALLAFAADVVTEGTVLGADRTRTPDEVTRVLGPDFGENRRDDVMWRDYGLVEFFWERRSRHAPWTGTHFSVQVHRLDRADPGLVEEAIEKRYGVLTGARLRFDDLRASVDGRGGALREVPEASPGCRVYRHSGSQASVVVMDDGYVWSISAP
ncbi:hypothetical protein [Actinomadura fibrosa]|uniref:Uncharacterized protein n=1 Tax=Actinomadura fibrosa TaxID=111802 RepID=A0ABW2XT26_9ACTN|nr:hypothetical protein [Actinomadura fibrosa]